MFKRKEKPEDILSRYVPKDFGHKLTDVKTEPKQPYYYTVLYLAVEQPEDAAGLTAECVKIILKYNGVVHALISTFIFVSFEGSAPQASMLQANELLLGIFKDKIRIVCGKVDTYYANLGSETALRYSLVMPDFDKVLKLLVSIGDGKSTQYNL